MKEQIRSHTPKYRTERVRFRFRAEGKEQRAEEPTYRERVPFSKSLGRASSLGSWLEHATCIPSRSNPRSQACVWPPSAPHQTPQAHVQQRNGSDMSIMRAVRPLGPTTPAGPTYQKWGRAVAWLLGSTPAFFAKLLQGQGSLCFAWTMQQAIHSFYTWRALLCYKYIMW